MFMFYDADGNPREPAIEPDPYEPPGSTDWALGQPNVIFGAEQTQQYLPEVEAPSVGKRVSLPDQFEAMDMTQAMATLAGFRFMG